MSFDLRNEISDLDKKRMLNYITSFGYNDGIPEELFVGLDTFLENWAKSKLRLYHLFGNKLMIKVPFKYTKDEEDIAREIGNLLLDHPFMSKFSPFLEKNIRGTRKYIELSQSEKEILMVFERKFTYIFDKTGVNLKIKPAGYQKMLQISANMKPIRAIQKLLIYFQAPEVIMQAFEDFRCQHSLIFNDKIIESNLILSIHPFDFITMSDNNSRWGSCMNWINNGCYHAGTLEMMNSNVVICAYLESKTPFVFRDEISYLKDNIEREPQEEWCWNNKKWRQLFYVHKDIIVSGKAYPYYSEQISKKVLEILRDLAFKNNQWTYKYGIEQYFDMTSIWSMSRMDNQREWLKENDTRKKNILFDSKLMYNDMLNDNDYPYWCIRNPIKKRKIISYSGKANCLCCNNSLQVELVDPTHYNERYSRCDDVICYECLTNSQCNICNLPFKKIYIYKDNEGNKIGECCEDCFHNFLRLCPCCGKNVISINDSSNDHYINIHIDNYKNPTTSLAETWKWRSTKMGYDTLGVSIKVCSECYQNKNLLEEKFNIHLDTTHSHICTNKYFGIVNTPAQIEPYLQYLNDRLKPIKENSKTLVSFNNSHKKAIN